MRYFAAAMLLLSSVSLICCSPIDNTPAKNDTDQHNEMGNISDFIPANMVDAGENLADSVIVQNVIGEDMRVYHRLRDNSDYTFECPKDPRCPLD